MIKYISQVLFILKGARKQLVLLLAVFIVISGLEAFGIGSVGPFLWLASEPSHVTTVPALNWLYTHLQIDTPERFIAVLGISLAVIFCLKAFLSFLARSYVCRFSLIQRSRLISILLRSYLYAPYSFFLDEKNSSADLIGRMTRDAEEFCHSCLMPMLDFTSNVMTTLVLILLLASTDPILLMMILAVLVPTFLTFYVLKSRATIWGEEASESYKDGVRVIQHSLGSIKETRVIGCESYFESQMLLASKRNIDAVTGIFGFQIMPRITIETLIIVLVLVVVSLSQVFFARSVGDILPVLSIFAVASIRLIPAYSQLLTAWGMMQTSRYAVETLYADIKSLQLQTAMPLHGLSSLQRSPHKPSIAQLVGLSAESVEPFDFRHQIELQDITYFYPKATEPSLNGISLNLSKGESIALIGRSGAGKTTLVDMILGFFEPTQGDICVDGRSVYENLRGWQNLIGYIPQSIFLMNDTVERNIAFGVPDEQIDPVRLQQAIEAAQLVDLVERLPQGVKTPVGDRGVRLSGGQRQRVGIARALYHEREILVLDEATAALDNETERLVTESIQALSGVKTMIIIAHRLSTVQHCDRIYLLDRGKIIQSGSYEEVVGGQVVR